MDKRQRQGPSKTQVTFLLLSTRLRVFVFLYLLCFSYIEPYFTAYPFCLLDSLIQEVQDLLGCPAEEPVSSQWKERQSSTLQKWTTLRPFMVNQMLSSERPKQELCQHCGQKLAVVTCRDCLPRPLYCTVCDITIHESMALHNRTSMIEGFFQANVTFHIHQGR